MNSVTFVAPSGVSRRFIAQCFNVYVLGANALLHDSGPWEKREGDDSLWQIDPHNDFWLRFDSNPDNPSEVRFTGRYESDRHVQIVRSAVALFQASFPAKERVEGV